VASSIEAPFTLLQIPVKTLRFDPIKTPQMALGLVPKILDSLDVVSFFCK
jgi:hypothetical protein